MKMNRVGKYLELASPFHCDVSHELFIGHLGNHMLNAADFHSRDRGFGMNYLNTVNKTWVLSRLAIELDAIPRQYDRFYVETWVESAMRFFTNRNFRIVSEDERMVYGYGRSIWAMIDTETRQPCNLMEINNGDLMNWVETEEHNPMDKLSRVKMDDNATLVRTLPTKYSDVDINGHINSVKYIEHVLDLWEQSWYEQYRVHRFDVAYVAEAYQGDILSFYMQPAEENAFCVRICKENTTEVVRSKVTFVKR